MSAKPISLYPSAELRARIERVAAAEDRSMNWLCLRWVEEGLAAAENESPSQLRSIAVVGDRMIDMVTQQEVDPATLEPKERPRRTARCEHGFSPDQHCKRCDP